MSAPNPAAIAAKARELLLKRQALLHAANDGEKNDGKKSDIHTAFLNRHKAQNPTIPLGMVGGERPNRPQMFNLGPPLDPFFSSMTMPPPFMSPRIPMMRPPHVGSHPMGSPPMGFPPHMPPMVGRPPMVGLPGPMGGVGSGSNVVPLGEGVPGGMPPPAPAGPMLMPPGAVPMGIMGSVGVMGPRPPHELMQIGGLVEGPGRLMRGSTGSNNVPLGRPRRQQMSGWDDEGESPAVDAPAGAPVTGDDAPAEAPDAGVADAVKPMEVWEIHGSPQQGIPYYYHRSTKRSVWKPPPNVTFIDKRKPVKLPMEHKPPMEGEPAGGAPAGPNHSMSTADSPAVPIEGDHFQLGQSAWVEVHPTTGPLYFLNRTTREKLPQPNPEVTELLLSLGRDWAQEEKEREESRKKLSDALKQEMLEEKKKLEEEFREMVRNLSLPQGCSYKLALPRMMHDTRFKNISKYERKSLFEATVKSLQNEQKHEEAKDRLQRINIFSAFLDELVKDGDIRPFDTVEKVKKHFGAEAAWKDLGSDDNSASVLKLVEERISKVREQYETALAEKKNGLTALIERSIRQYIVWNNPEKFYARWTPDSADKKEKRGRDKDDLEEGEEREQAPSAGGSRSPVPEAWLAPPRWSDMKVLLRPEQVYQDLDKKDREEIWRARVKELFHNPQERESGRRRDRRSDKEHYGEFKGTGSNTETLGAGRGTRRRHRPEAAGTGVPEREAKRQLGDAEFKSDLDRQAAERELRQLLEERLKNPFCFTYEEAIEKVSKDSRYDLESMTSRGLTESVRRHIFYAFVDRKTEEGRNFVRRLFASSGDRLDLGMSLEETIAAIGLESNPSLRGFPIAELREPYESWRAKQLDDALKVLKQFLVSTPLMSDSAIPDALSTRKIDDDPYLVRIVERLNEDIRWRRLDMFPQQRERTLLEVLSGIRDRAKGSKQTKAAADKDAAEGTGANSRAGPAGGPSGVNVPMELPLPKTQTLRDRGTEFGRSAMWGDHEADFDVED